MQLSLSENIKIFNNAEFGEIRVMLIDDDPWFVGKDIAAALGYVNTKDALAKHVDEQDKRQGDGVAFCDPMGREQHPTIINESGLYSLIFSSKLESAQRFKHWVTHEVLPSIRKHGMYMTDNLLETAIANPDFVIGLIQNMKAEKEKSAALQMQNKQLCEKNEEMQDRKSSLKRTTLTTSWRGTCLPISARLQRNFVFQNACSSRCLFLTDTSTVTRARASCRKRAKVTACLRSRNTATRRTSTVAYRPE